MSPTPCPRRRWSRATRGRRPRASRRTPRTRPAGLSSTNRGRYFFFWSSVPARSRTIAAKPRAEHLIGDAGIAEGELLRGDAVGDAVEGSAPAELLGDRGGHADLVDLAPDLVRGPARRLAVPGRRSEDLASELAKRLLECLLLLGRLKVKSHPQPPEGKGPTGN